MWKRWTQPFGPIPEGDKNQINVLASVLLIILLLGIGAGIIYVIWSEPAGRWEAFFGSLIAVVFLLLPYLVSRTRFYRIAAVATSVIFALLVASNYQYSESLGSLAPVAGPVFLVTLFNPLGVAILVALANILFVVLLPQWQFGIPWQEAILNGVASIWFLIGFSFLVAIQYKRVITQQHSSLVAKEEALRESQTQLEERIAERTAELQAANASLQQEIEERTLIAERLNERDKQLSELNQQVVTAQEEERRRMSRELHDDAGQALTALRFNLALIRDQVRVSAMEGGQSAVLPQMLDDAVERVDMVMGRIRSLAHGLRPAALDDLGLHPALEGLCADFSAQTGLTIDYEGHPTPLLSDAAEISLYRFLQEALTNAARHAAARNIQVRLTFDEQAVFLSVTDDGQGFDPDFLAFQPQAGSSGIGLLGIRERLEAQGGRLELFSQPGQGTHLTARVPRPAELPAIAVIAPPEIALAPDQIRVVIAEDHHVVRAAVAEWLNREEDIKVVGEVDDGADLLPMVEETQPTVLLLDVHMPNQRATEAVIAIRSRFPHVRILIFSAYDRPEYVVSLVTAGVMGYVLKDDSPRTVLQAIRSVAAGNTWLTPRVADTLHAGNGSRDDSPLRSMTPREMEVLQLMVDGVTNEEIAETLVLSVQTVRNHASAIYRKLEVNTRVEAVLAAIRLGMKPSPREDGGPPYTQSPGSGD